MSNMVKYTSGSSPGKATKPGGPKSLLQNPLKVLYLSAGGSSSFMLPPVQQPLKYQLRRDG